MPKLDKSEISEKLNNPEILKIQKSFAAGAGNAR
jgi:hypothetical protein